MTPPHHTPPGSSAGSTMLTEYIDLFGERYGAAIAAAPAPAVPWAPHRPALRVGRHPLAALGAVLAVAAAIVIAMALPTGTHLSLVDRASAALGAPNEIIHFETYSVTPPDPSSHPDCDRGITRTWQTTSGPPRWRIQTPAPFGTCGQLMTADGKHVTGYQEEAVDGNTVTDYIPNLKTLDILIGAHDLPADGPSIAGAARLMGNGRARDFVSNLQGMLQQGELVQVGAVRIERGRRVIVLAGAGRIVNGSGKSKNVERIDTTYVVDASTFVPLRLTTKMTVTYVDRNGKPRASPDVYEYTVVFRLYERLPLNSDTEKLLEIHPTGPVTTRTETPAQRAARLGQHGTDPPDAKATPVAPRPSTTP